MFLVHSFDKLQFSVANPRENSQDIVLLPDEIKEFEIYKGGTALFVWKKTPDFLLRIRPTGPPPRPCRTYIPGTNLSYDYVMLGLTRMKEDCITISNVDQIDYPAVFEMDICRKDPKGTIHVSASESGHDVVDAFQFLEFVRTLARVGRIALKDLKTNRLLMEASVTIPTKPIDDAYFMAIERASLIQQATGVLIPWPREFTRNDLLAIDAAYSAITQGFISMSSASFILKVKKKKTTTKEMDTLFKVGYLENVQYS